MLSGGRGGWPVVQMAGLFLAAYLITAYEAYLAFTARIPSGNDFFSRWAG